MISEITQKLLEKFVIEIKKPDNIVKIQSNIVDPVITYAYFKLYPYFVFIIILFLIIAVLLLTNFFILLKIFLTKRI